MPSAKRAFWHFNFKIKYTDQYIFMTKYLLSFCHFITFASGKAKRSINKFQIISQ